MVRIEGKGTPVARPKYWAMGWKSLGGSVEEPSGSEDGDEPDLGQFNGEVAEEDELGAVPLFRGRGDFLLVGRQ